MEFDRFRLRTHGGLGWGSRGKGEVHLSGDGWWGWWHGNSREVQRRRELVGKVKVLVVFIEGYKRFVLIRDVFWGVGGFFLF
jgi:hypothetical protein